MIRLLLKSYNKTKELELLNYTLEKKVRKRTKSIENQLYFDSLKGLKSYQALSRDVEKSNFMFTTLMLVNIDNFVLFFRT